VDLLLNFQTLKEKSYESIRKALFSAGYKNRDVPVQGFRVSKTAFKTGLSERGFAHARPKTGEKVGARMRTGRKKVL